MGEALSRRVTFFLIAGLLLGAILLIQRSMTTYYAYRCSELEQEKKVMLKQLSSLEVELRRLTRPQVLHDYWAKNREQFDFQMPFPPEKAPVVEDEERPQRRAKVQYTSLRGSQR